MIKHTSSACTSSAIVKFHTWHFDEPVLSHFSKDVIQHNGHAENRIYVQESSPRERFMVPARSVLAMLTVFFNDGEHQQLQHSYPKAIKSARMMKPDSVETFNLA